ncbi:MAG TPA: hypothetical protein VM871_02355, partial [Flavisolibacter sp.]|nr:hypothetical protein [Flavisolibacter sp.]
SFDVSYSIIGLQTIWAIGISMMLLGVISWLPFKAILALGLLIVLGHNSLDFYEAGHRGGYDLVYSLLHRPGVYPVTDAFSILVLYPFLPWVGLMTMGFCFGKLFMRFEGAKKKQVLLRLGIGLIAFFIFLRATNVYGDPVDWTTQKTVFHTVLSFISINKYPPSLLYMCITIGPAILFLAFTEGVTGKASRIISVYGKVPFLYYVLHFFLLHTLAMGLFFASGHSAAEAQKLPNDLPEFIIPGQGYSLFVVYAVWLGVVAALYPVCRWFSSYKQTHKQWWLSYL